ncbi:right-handed parallel beta-helix repeat-containing protein [Sphaerisporangium sp. TRM90804]|uniref:right-handed parallel beta-helix repeat-containing protein n=1 Tax=Sphaerisporangium sp. TRM90804 TaxID=3031113 RepID=UPI002447F88A|nr:right-handed parallel beta-helix repeat-containing protein [Sphaerisporangium sp. TRM90804]MDH2428941.1 right-handed parallel beta-helix repeat-containing protein [Sphaerisporangium sp. TRM90804]
MPRPFRTRAQAIAAVLAIAGTTGAWTTLDTNAAPARETWGTAGPLKLGTARYPVPAAAKFVATTGNDKNDGSRQKPWRTLGHAVKTAKSGATIVVRGGIYHEYVQVYGKRLTIQNQPGEAVWFDGTVPVTGWVAQRVEHEDGGTRTVWRRDGWTTRFDNTDPTAGGGDDWHMVGEQNPVANWPDQMFVNGQQQVQVESLDKVKSGTFFVDYKTSRLYVGYDPAGRDVRAATLAEALYVNKAHGTTVRGLGFRRYATPLKRMGAVKGYADNLLFENNVFADTAVAGLSITGSGITVRHNSFLRNGQLGLHGHRAGGASIVGNLASGNNWESFMMAPVSGGIKITTSVGMNVTGNRADRNRGPGIWLDESVADTTVSGNLAYANAGHGIHYEISARGLIVGNVAADNKGHGIYVNEASDVRIWHNNALRNARSQIDVVDGGRQTSDPDMPWNVSGVEVRNNVLAGPAPLLSVQDLTGRRTAPKMASLNGNLYYRTSGSDLLRWVDSSARLRVLADVPTARERARQEAAGDEANGAPRYSDSASLLPAPTGLRGLPVPAVVAELMGWRTGEKHPVGVPASSLQ